MKRVDRIARGIIAFIVIVIPLLSSQRLFFASTFLQSVIFFASAVILSAIVLARYNVRDAVRPLPLPMLGAFVLALGLSAVLNDDIFRSTWSTLERMWGVAMHVAIFGFVVSMFTVFRGKEQVRVLIRYVVIGVAAVSAYALIQWMLTSSLGRIDGSIGNAAFLASYVLLGSFFMLLYAAVQDVHSGPTRYLWYGGFVAAGTTLVLTGTRGSLVGLFVGGATLMALVLYKNEARDAWGLRRSTLVKLAKITLGIGILMIVAFIPLRPYLAKSSVQIFQRVGEVSFSSRAVTGRLVNWSVALRGIRERPVLGWGPEQYHLLYDKYYDPQLYAIEPWVDRAHNNYLDVFAVSGGLGALLYLAVLALGIRGGWMLRKTSWAAGNTVIAGIVAYGINALFIFDTLWTWLMLLILISVPYLLLNDHVVRKVSGISGRVRGVALGIVAIGLIWYGAIAPLVTSAYGKAAYDALAERNDDKAFQLYERALKWETLGSVDIDRSLAEYVFDFVRKGGERDNASLLRATEHAQEAMDRNIVREVENGKWWLWAGQLASLHSTLNDEQSSEMLARAVVYLNGAVLRMPNRAQVLLELAQVYRVQGDEVNMRDVLDRAIAIWPDYPLPHANAAVQYIYVGDRSREKTELAWLRIESWPREGMKGEEDRHSPDRDMMLIRDAYYNVERYSDAADIQQEIVSLLELRVSVQEIVTELQALAFIQAKAGNRAAARDTALHVLELDPSQKEAVEAFLHSIGY